MGAFSMFEGEGWEGGGGEGEGWGWEERGWGEEVSEGLGSGCCYWDVWWALGAGVMILAYFCLLVANVLCLVRLNSVGMVMAANDSMCKKLFHRSSILLSGFRVFTFVLYFCLFQFFPQLRDPSTRFTGLFYLVQLCNASSLIFFLLVYGTLLLFWAIFYLHIRKRKMPNLQKFRKQMELAIMIIQAFFFILFIVNIGLSCFFEYGPDMYPVYFCAFVLVLGIIMTLEALAFVIVGILLYQALSDGKSRCCSPTYLTGKPLQVICLAVILTTLMLTRAVLLFLEVDFSDARSRDNDNVLYNSKGHLLTGIFPPEQAYSYYVIGEIFPLLVMLLFQARIKRQRKPRKTLQEGVQERKVGEGEEGMYLLQESGGDGEEAGKWTWGEGGRGGVDVTNDWVSNDDYMGDDLDDDDYDIDYEMSTWSKGEGGGEGAGVGEDPREGGREGEVTPSYDGF